MLKLKPFTLLTPRSLCSDNDQLTFLLDKMLISHDKNKIKKFVFLVLLLKKAHIFSNLLFMFLSNLMKEEDKMKQSYLQLSKELVWHIEKMTDRKSSYIFCATLIVMPVLKFYSVKDCVNL